MTGKSHKRTDATAAFTLLLLNMFIDVIIMDKYKTDANNKFIHLSTTFYVLIRTTIYLFGLFAVILFTLHCNILKFDNKTPSKFGVAFFDEQ